METEKSRISDRHGARETEKSVIERQTETETLEKQSVKGTPHDNTVTDGMHLFFKVSLHMTQIK